MELNISISMLGQVSCFSHVWLIFLSNLMIFRNICYRDRHLLMSIAGSCGFFAPEVPFFQRTAPLLPSPTPALDKKSRVFLFYLGLDDCTSLLPTIHFFLRVDLIFKKLKSLSIFHITWEAGEAAPTWPAFMNKAF